MTFRKSVAPVSMVLFFFCVVGLGFLIYQLAIVRDDRTFNAWSFFRAMSVSIPLSVAAVTVSAASVARRSGHPACRHTE
ncbi:hypothetical protein [Micromonospora sp. IBHARD004]|uniref:hypothetical protein n=1 Tax=Micromonospora sp. IBHARD004 TaxID=3457764 RepID=UPI0040586026